MSADNFRRAMSHPDIFTPHEQREGFNIHFPPVVEFPGLGFCFYILQGFRNPAPGEYYLAHPEPSDTDMVIGVRATQSPAVDVWVVRPSFLAKLVSLQWEIGDAIVPPDVNAEPESHEHKAK